MSQLDVEACRRAKPYSSREYVARVLWTCARPLFAWSPRWCFRWRALLLRLFGAKVGENVHIYPSCIIYLPWMLEVGDRASIGEWALIYNLGLVRVGADSAISHGAHICAGSHDYLDPVLPLLRLPVTIGAGAWVCSQAFVGPGCMVGEGAVVGARAVVVSDIPSWSVVAGNPAKVVKRRVVGQVSR